MVAYDRNFGYLYHAYGKTLLVFNAKQITAMMKKGDAKVDCFIKKEFAAPISNVLVDGKYLFVAAGIEVHVHNSESFLHSKGGEPSLKTLRIPLDNGHYIRQLSAETSALPKLLIVTSEYDLWEFNGNIKKAQKKVRSAIYNQKGDIVAVEDTDDALLLVLKSGMVDKDPPESILNTVKVDLAGKMENRSDGSDPNMFRLYSIAEYRQGTCFVFGAFY